VIGSWLVGARWPSGIPPEEPPELSLGFQPATPLWVLVQALALVEGQLAAGSVGPFVAARQLANWRQAAGMLSGGLSVLELELHAQILRGGGEVCLDADPLGLLVRDDRVCGAMLEGRPGTVRADQLLLGLEPAICERLLGSRLCGQLPRWPVVGRRHCMHLLFRRGWLPASMAAHVVIQPRGGDPTLIRGVVSDPTLTGDEVVMTLQLDLPARGASSDPSRAGRAALDAVRAVVPFFDESLASVVPLAPSGGPFGDAICAVPTGPGGGDGDPCGAAPAAPVNIDLPNVAFVSTLVLGPLGLEGACATAWAGAELLCS